MEFLDLPKSTGAFRSMNGLRNCILTNVPRGMAPWLPRCLFCFSPDGDFEVWSGEDG